jgi:rod shape-determining protein MreC
LQELLMRHLFKRHQTAILAVLLLLAMLLVYSFNLRQKSSTTLMERVVLALTEPLQAALTQSGRSVAALWERYVWLVDTQEQNLALVEENRELRASLQGVTETRLENQRLKKLLDFVETDPRPVLPAMVVAEDAGSWARTIVIDKGERQGVREGLPVVVAEGVVGRVIKVAPGSARVLLVIDASSSVAGLVQRFRTRGVARGNGRGLSFEYALREAVVEVGDLVVTSGMGGLFPKGLVLGQVTSVQRQDSSLFQQIELRPNLDFSRLEEVLVLLEPKL